MRLRNAVLLTGVGLAAGALAEPHFPVLRRASVPVLPVGAPSLTVLHLSDLHLLPRHGRRSRWMRSLAAERADLAVVTGDLWSSVHALPLLGSTLAALTADGTPGVFVPGNNDYYAPLPPSFVGYFTGAQPRRHGPNMPWHRVVTMLEQVGWTDLTHRRTTISLRGLSVTLTGTDDAHLRRDRYALVAGPVSSDIAIGVTHTPQRRVLDAFVADGHELLLAGHTHGGQVRLPGYGALVTNCDLDRSRARGLSRHGSAWLHVAAGLGTSPYAPIRFCCRPEATLLTLTAVR
ncbi:MAG: metallophosphoesterase [Frankiaceae bacterium]|nr:metallophosphoesterase [Frankiaceae bacterium]